MKRLRVQEREVGLVNQRSETLLPRPNQWLLSFSESFYRTDNPAAESVRGKQNRARLRRVTRLRPALLPRRGNNGPRI